ncbi:double-stranded RNA-binding protein 1-like isoform X2 [Aristolochia californica]|uniref:double-stranded RNA-binding protein 1-like isoform X2 n=1 Tax=Aristolochia californica TaxID=171875 RepID=UPI0035E2C025
MHKSRLQELCHQNLWSLPNYSIVKDGPDHVPHFTATVTVNGISFHTVASCKSSKEAQNEVAKIAFRHYTTPQESSTGSTSPSCSSSTSNELSASAIVEGLSQVSSNSESNGNTSIVGPCESSKKLDDSAIIKDSSQVPHSSQFPVGETMESEMQLYKNQLQSFAMKKNLGLPKYVCNLESTPLTRQFKASVTVGEQTYESPGFFRTVKEAEHAAAKAAFLSMSQGSHEEEAVIHKNLLQELCQKEGFVTPVYKTTSSGESHIPTFSSTVEVDGKLFGGIPAKTKKKAEMSAAKIAWFELKESRRTVLPAFCSTVDQMEVAAQEHTALHSQSMTSLDLNKNLKSNINPVLPPEFRSEYPRRENAGKEKQETGSSSQTRARDKETMDHSSSPQMSHSLLPEPTSDKGKLETGASSQKETMDHSTSPQMSVPLLSEPTSGKWKLETGASSRTPTRVKETMEYSTSPRMSVPLLAEPTSGKGKLETGASSSTLAYNEDGPGHSSPPGEDLERASPIVKKSDEIYAHLRDPFSEESDADSDSDRSVIDQRAHLPSVRSGCSLLCKRIMVYPRASDMKLPPGAIPLPIDDDMWIAVSLEFPDQENVG